MRLPNRFQFFLSSLLFTPVVVASFCLIRLAKLDLPARERSKLLTGYLVWLALYAIVFVFVLVFHANEFLALIFFLNAGMAALWGEWRDGLESGAIFSVRGASGAEKYAEVVGPGSDVKSMSVVFSGLLVALTLAPVAYFSRGWIFARGVSRDLSAVSELEAKKDWENVVAAATPICADDRSPEAVEACVKLGNGYLRLDRFESALTAGEEACDSEDGVGCAISASALCRLNRTAEAMERLKESVKFLEADGIAVDREALKSDGDLKCLWGETEFKALVREEDPAPAAESGEKGSLAEEPAGERSEGEQSESEKSKGFEKTAKVEREEKVLPPKPSGLKASVGSHSEKSTEKKGARANEATESIGENSIPDKKAKSAGEPQALKNVHSRQVKAEVELEAEGETDSELSAVTKRHGSRAEKLDGKAEKSGEVRPKHSTDEAGEDSERDGTLSGSGQENAVKSAIQKAYDDALKSEDGDGAEAKKAKSGAARSASGK